MRKSTAIPVTGMRFAIRDQRSLLEHLFKKCSVRLGTREEYKKRKQLLKTIEASVRAGKFSPRTIGFLSSSKGQGVARFVPVLDSWTTIVYFACVRAVDEACANAAVEGTYGGWSLGGARRAAEEAQVRKLIEGDPVKETASAIAAVQMPVAGDAATEDAAKAVESADDETVELDLSAPVSPYNKLAWLQNWQEFWKMLKLQCDAVEDNQQCVSFDIANYYDTLDLKLLENRLRSTCPDETEAINVLFELLRSWNRALRGYQETTKGIPMDMVGDMSRVLANFNLTGFDADFKSEVEKIGGSYRRWADDIFFCASSDQVVPLIYRASSLLHSLGLNINASKVRVRTRCEFHAAWRFDILDKLAAETTAAEGVKLLQDSWNDANYERKKTALKRSLTVLRGLPCLANERQWAYETTIGDSDLCISLSSGQLQSLVVCSGDASNAIPAVSKQVMECPFTQAKTEWLRCLERQRKNADRAYGEAYKTVRESMFKSEDPVLALAAKHSESPS
jgi:hypothetical protein